MLPKLSEIGEIVVLNTPVRRVKDAAAALGVGEDKIIKTIVVLCNGVYKAYIVRGSKKIDLAKLGCRLASPEEVLEATGYPVGGVPPVLPIPVFIDKELLKEEYVYGGGGDEYSLLKFKPLLLVQLGLATPLDL
ncbi:MAG: YbaK/EbsC family protein [Pyrobaculum sp.]